MSESNELERYEESEISLLPRQQAPAAHAMAVLAEASQAMDIAWRYASSVCKTAVCPQRFRGKPEDGAAAILYGLEVGLSPAQSLQRVVVIHGMPSLEARTMVGLLQARGYQVSTHTIDDTHAEIWGWYPDSPKVYDTDPASPFYGQRINPDSKSRWTIERATQAGYVPTINPATGKYRTNSSGKLIGNEKYITDPQAMLKAKGQAEVSRDLAPEVLMGIQYATEDLQSESWDGTISREPARGRSQPVSLGEILGEAAPAPAPQQPEDAEVVDTDTAAVDPEATETGDRFYREPEGQAPAPEAGQVDSRQQVTPEEPENAAPAQPEQPATAPEEQPGQAAPEPAPEAGSDDEAGPEGAEQIPGLADAKVRQMFALLRKGGMQAREDRLAVMRSLSERPEISSTRDLTTRDLNKIVAKLKGWDESNTIEADCGEIIWAAVQAEANAPVNNEQGE